MKLHHKTFDGFVLKSISGSETDMIFDGYGAIFGNVDSYGDTIVKGAFAGSIEKAQKTGIWPAMLAQHGGFTADDNTPVGIWTSIEEDDIGLKLSGKLANIMRGRDLYQLLKMEPRPAITGLSIGYIPTKWKAGEGAGQPDRILQEIDLWEVSLVTFPANREARVSSVKSIEELGSLRDIERHLRDAGGFSRAEVKALVARVKESLREADRAKAAADNELIQALNRNIKLFNG